MRRALLMLFFLTGGTALGYQLVWARMLANTLGHEMQAVITVVSGFMGGMALGAWWFGGQIRRSARPGRWYAGLEIFIGVWGILCAFRLPQAPMLLLPATMAMGASFPAMERFIRPLAPRGKDIAALYASNTAGAVAGILAVTWWLMPELGLRKTALILAALNLLAGLVAWSLMRGSTEAEREIGPSDERLFITVAITGFLAIAFEILGVRVLSQVTENTVYSFGAALAVYLLGTSLGAAVYHRFGHERLMNELLGAAAIVCLGSILVMSKAQTIYNTVRAASNIVAADVVLALSVFLLPSMVMGAIFSLLMQRQPGRFSQMLAANTFGSALAPFFVAVAILPEIGSKWALVLVSLAYFALVTKFQWVMPAVAAGMVFFLPDLRFVQPPPGGSIVKYREGVMASVAVVRDAAGDRTLKVNNRFQMGGTSAAATEYRQAHLPLLLHPKPARALFLGTGTGITFGAASLYPELEADGVELVPEIVELMEHFQPQNFHRDHPDRLRAYVADARRFVKKTERLYDVIVGDLFHPARDGAGTLYTREHFAAIHARLNEGGMFCQWLPLHQMDEFVLRVVTRTFIEVFPDARAYLLHLSVDVPVLGLIGAGSWPTYTNGWVEARAAQSDRLQRHLKSLALADSVRLFGSFVASAGSLRKFAGDAPINTDDHQIVTYAAPRFSYQQGATPYGRLLTVLELENLTNDFGRARNVYLRGLVDETEGRMSQATEKYIESARISGDFTMGYARCLTLASSIARDQPKAARTLLERLAEAQPQQKLARDLLQRFFPEPQQ